MVRARMALDPATGRDATMIYADEVVEVPNLRYYRRRLAVGDLVAGGRGAGAACAADEPASGRSRCDPRGRGVADADCSFAAGDHAAPGALDRVQRGRGRARAHAARQPAIAGRHPGGHGDSAAVGAGAGVLRCRGRPAVRARLRAGPDVPLGAARRARLRQGASDLGGRAGGAGGGGGDADAHGRRNRDPRGQRPHPHRRPDHRDGRGRPTRRPRRSRRRWGRPSARSTASCRSRRPSPPRSSPAPT